MTPPDDEDDLSEADRRIVARICDLPPDEPAPGWEERVVERFERERRPVSHRRTDDHDDGPLARYVHRREAAPIATETQIAQLRLHAVNDVTRAIMADGVHLTHEQADDLGEEALAWIGGRLGLNVRGLEVRS